LVITQLFHEGAPVNPMSSNEIRHESLEFFDHHGCFSILERSVDRIEKRVRVELCPRALDVLKRRLALRAEYVAAGKITHKHLILPRRRQADQRPGNHPLALERKHQGAQYSKARTLPRATFLRDLAAHAGKESALGREAART
jgi:hypothetical protein